MGYNIRKIDSSFSLPYANERGAFRAVQRVARSTQGLSTTSLDNAMLACRLNLVRDENSVITDVQFIGENFGDDFEEALLSLGPYVTAGSYVEFVGEEGARWKYEYDGRTCARREAKVTY